MAVTTSKGNTTSFTNTPQAGDDTFYWTEDSLLASGLLSGNGNIITLDVMANDLGGNAKTLFSIDDGNGHTNLTDYDLLNADNTGAGELTAGGNQIAIVNGKIQLNLTQSLAALGATDVNSLGAGDHIHDEFVYAIRLANGTLSQAKVTVDIQGQNDAAYFAAGGDTSSNLTEDATTPAIGTLTVVDSDHGQSHTQAANNAASDSGLGTYSVDADGHWRYTVDNALVQHLTASANATDSFTIRSLDGTASRQVTITIQGVNDAPAVTGPVTHMATEDGASSILDALANASDVDDGTTLSVVNVPATLPAGVSYDASTHSFTFDPTNAAYQYLAVDQPTTVTVNYAVTDDIASTPASVSWRLAGTNDAPTLQAPVATDPVFGNDSLTVTDTLAFADLDLTDTHAVTFAPQGSGYIGDFLPVITADANGHGSITATYHLTRDQVVANGGHFPDHQDYLVTIDDHHGGTSSQVVSIPLAQILSGVGGGGGGGTTVQPPVATNTSPPNPFTSGHNLGQIDDNPFVLDPGQVDTNYARMAF